MAVKIVTFFNIVCLCGEHRWTLSKRYNEFHELHQALEHKYADLPDFPGKSYLKVSGSSLESRRAGLEVYIKVSLSRGRVCAPDERLWLTNVSELFLKTQAQHWMSTLDENLFIQFSSLRVQNKH